MAWAYQGGIGNTADKTSASTVAFNAAATVAVGRVIVVMVTADNNGTSDSDAGDEITSVTDASGNTYTKIRERVNGSPGAANGAVAATFYTKVTTELTSGNAVTANYNGAHTGRNIRAFQFTIGAGNVVTIADQVSGTPEEATTTPAATISGLTSQEYLFVSALAIEGPFGDTFTESTGYTGGRNGSTGGSAASNMTLAAAHRVLTGTGDTYAPTLGTARDTAHVFAALKEAAGGTTHEAAASVSLAVTVASVGAAIYAGAGAVASAISAAASAALLIASTASVAVALTVSGAGSATYAGAGTAGVVVSTAATGTVETGGGTTHLGAASVTVSVSAAGTGALVLPGSAALPVAITTQAAGTVEHRAAASVSTSVNAIASSSVTHPAATSVGVAITASGAGAETYAGAGSGSVAFTSAAAGTVVPAGGTTHEAAASAAVSITSSGSGTLTLPPGYQQRHRSPFTFEINIGPGANPAYESKTRVVIWPSDVPVTKTSGNFEDLNEIIALGPPTAAIPPPAPTDDVPYFEEPDVAAMLELEGQDVSVGGQTTKGILKRFTVEQLMGEWNVPILGTAIVVQIKTDSLTALAIGVDLGVDGDVFKVRDIRQVGDGALTEVLLAET